MLSSERSVEWLAPYGAMLAIAFLIEWLVARRRSLASGIDPSHIDCLVPLTLAAGLAAAPLLSFFLVQERWLAGEAVTMESRLRLPALLVGSGAVVVLYCRIGRLSISKLADVLAPAVLLAFSILRIGCFLGGCCFGDVVGNTDRVAAIEDPALRYQIQSLPALSSPGQPWAVRFPARSAAHQQHASLGLLREEDHTSLPVHPVQLYEALGALALCLGVTRFEKRGRVPGAVALTAALGYAGLSFVLQFLRADNAAVLGPLAATQVFYLACLLLAGEVGFVRYGANRLRSPPPLRCR